MGKIVKPVWYFISCMNISLNHGENCKASLVLYLLKKKHFVSFQVMGKCFFKVTLAVSVAHDKDFILCTCTNNKTTNKIFSKNPRLYNEAKQMLFIGQEICILQLYAAKRASLPPTNLKFGFHLPLLSGKTNKDLRRSLIKWKYGSLQHRNLVTEVQYSISESSRH